MAIQTATAKTVVVEANAGAAKTTTIALRVAESWRHGLRPEQILALTYTQTACAALKATLKKLDVPFAVASRIRIRTFEEFATEVLDEMLDVRIPVFARPEDLGRYVWQAVRRVERSESERWRSHLSLPTWGAPELMDEFLRVNAVLKGTMRDLLERPGNSVTPEYAEFLGVDYTQLRVFLAYENIRRQENADRPLFRGPGDATYDLARMLLDDEPVTGLKTWPFSVRTLVVDEMHDLNEAMFRTLVSILNTSNCFFCGVGDSDQVIYENAGADNKFMRREIEERTRRVVTRFPLTPSFRFSMPLAGMAGNLANKPYSSMAEHTTDFSVAEYGDSHECAQMVVDLAIQRKALPRAKMSEMAILLRHSYQTIDIENAFLDKDLSYVVSGFESYLERPEVLFVRGIFAVASGQFAAVMDTRTRAKIMHALILFSGATVEVEGREHDTTEQLMEEAVELVNGNPQLLGTLFYENHVLRTADPEKRRRVEAAVSLVREDGNPSLTELLRVLGMKSLINDVYVTRERRLDAQANVAGLERAARGVVGLETYFQGLNVRQQKQAGPKDPASVLISDVLYVKGLEFEQVVLPFLEDGVFPSSYGTAREEQNKFYVGLTRARCRVTLLKARGTSSTFVTKVSATPQRGRKAIVA